jgi:type VI secretion system secreted protein Hcp
MNRARRIALATIASVTAAVAIAPSAFAASDYFLKVDQAQGESPAIDMKGAIDVRSFELGIESPITIGSATGGAGTGKAAFNEVTIEKNIDATTPFFFQRLTTGQQIPGMELLARRPATSAPYLRYCFTTVFVSGQKQASGDEGPVETLTFRIGGMQESYIRQGAPTAITANWSQILNHTLVDPLPAPCGK